MKYPYSVKHNGVWYTAGTEIPADNAPVAKEIAPKAEPKDEPKSEPKLTKGELMRMNAANVRKLAMENGIKDVDDKTRQELIQTIAEKLGL